MPSSRPDLLIEAEPLLGPAIEAARSTLSDLEEGEIPARLRRVASHSGGRLPPPFVRLLLRALDEDEWLRGKVLESWEQGGPRPEERASELFLRREDGWQFELGLMAARSGVSRLEDRLARLEAEVQGLQGELSEARRRTRESKHREEEVSREAEERLEEARERALSAGEGDRARVRALERELAELTILLDATRAGLEDERERVAMLRSRLAEERGRRPDSPERPSPQVWAWSDPVELARLLDDLQVAVRPPPGPPVRAQRGSTARLEFPAGLRPDRAEAFDWLLGKSDPLAVVVDGYNVTHLLARRDPAGGTVRRRLERELRALVRKGGSIRSVLLVYDSSSGRVEEARARAGVEVRFAASGRSADDEIVAQVGALSGPVAVVTSDRELRQRVAAGGALTIWSEALVDWVRRRA